MLTVLILILVIVALFSPPPKGNLETFSPLHVLLLVLLLLFLLGPIPGRPQFHWPWCP